ncbi:hypothetical protein [Jeotgalibacillus sp. R-1-5s-1]|uniref:hypothetical protein n=1 Tax=Jeotgalibacillus sp. R-1-5s-1 TaxID=2555897 RepID=UPI00106B2B96|nr:hypothetical protein [Jeotgalibacillus sp. R-1-5s-1]TFD93613.1 hypothetical protein E2491_14320 [Jeotgalibacillus sp. R-1-5s-1]
MEFTFNMDFSVISILLSVMIWGIIILLIRRVYVAQPEGERPKVIKLIIVFLVGLFSFSIDLPFSGEILKVSILPLGVWVLYWILKRRNRWGNYRKYAWIGFFSNFLFLASVLLTIWLTDLIYPEDELETYISDVSNAELMVSHPTGDQASLDTESLKSSIQSFQLADTDVIEWYHDSEDWDIETNEPKEEDEKFPYLLINTENQQKLQYLIYIESDGKGLLVTTKDQQYYFRSDEAEFLLKGEDES